MLLQGQDRPTIDLIEHIQVKVTDDEEFNMQEVSRYVVLMDKQYFFEHEAMLDAPLQGLGFYRTRGP